MPEPSDLVAKLLAASPYKIVLSGPLPASKYRRITLTRADGLFRAELLTEKQAFHKSIPSDSAHEYITDAFAAFTNLTARCEGREFSARRTKSGGYLSGFRATSAAPAQSDPAHDREKNYVIAPGTAVPPLVDMGVMKADGTVIKSMYDKFRQVNRYLELISDAVASWNGGRMEIVDFGCGKSYLTFVLYYYLTEIAHIDAHITGVDLKADVVARCAALAEKYGYVGLTFAAADIKDFSPDGKVDMVVSLHACDTASDLAIMSAIGWGAQYIFAVPCCQHELNAQTALSALPTFAPYGILRERFCSLLTDSLRAAFLTYSGYRTQMLEFVDLTDTPKNILIRARKAALPRAAREKALSDAAAACESFGVTPSILSLARERGML